ncbi:MAG: class I SAM-dependent RNA methyltransferase [Chloroflexi bacterium]|nr:class I SAM-dependent RNA methyltransferase [Chloroflexota bacterium]MCI0578995.1 class I SAM-dependent RNA methyltransferase [Chloroflexota bacterium]MCI0644782.1 class I SAM-dependent RNA methyltransferase [Chloroflexota bacterium]MCI0731957.1 class I SAM-dependent RNA methyltransferase [Chloroflexota bacterium]
MATITLTLTDMAHGGAALGRDDKDRVIFVPLAIPGEKVQVEIVEDKKRYARGRLVEVLEPSPARVVPRCPHFGPCGGCQYQHIEYAGQLRFKETIVRDQLERIGGLAGVVVRPCLANPEPWAYRVDTAFNPAPGGGLGYWSPALGQVMPIEVCYIIRPELLELYQDVDLELPGLRRLTLRVGDGGALLAALEVEDVEPPALEADFPVSVSIVLPDGTAANLVGDNYLVQTIKERDFRVSAGVFFYPSPPATALLVDSVLGYAALTGAETVLEAYSGAGTLTAFLAPAAASLVAVEANPDAVADAAVNLDEFDNVSLYQGTAEAVLPLLDVIPQVMVVDPPAEGLSPAVLDQIRRLTPGRLVYVSADAATLARDGKRLAAAGYTLLELQPIDMFPQAFPILTVSAWDYRRIL